MKITTYLSGIVAACAFSALGSDLCVHTTDLQERDIPGISVTIKVAGTSVGEEGRTGRNGLRCFRDLQPGTYSVRVVSVSYFSVTYEDVALPVADEVRLKISLQLRDMSGFAVSEKAYVVGQLSARVMRLGPRKMCYSAGDPRKCIEVSRWGEYRMSFPRGVTYLIEVIDSSGLVLCSESIKAIESGPYSLDCSRN